MLITTLQLKALNPIKGENQCIYKVHLHAGFTVTFTLKQHFMHWVLQVYFAFQLVVTLSSQILVLPFAFSPTFFLISFVYYEGPPSLLSPSLPLGVGTVRIEIKQN